MSNYLLAIDPVLLLTKNDIKEITKNRQDSGEIGDAIKDKLQQQYEFADVFQSTDERHSVKVHEFLMAKKTGKREMHDVGELDTPTGLVAYVSVDDEWLKDHKKEASKGAYVELDPRVDHKLLHANDGATKDGRTTGFIRYDKYKTPVMAMVPTGPENYKDETIEEMEDRADMREASLRARQSKVQTIHNAYRNAKHGSVLDAFMAGWNLVDQLQTGESVQLNHQSNKQEQQNVDTDVPDLTDPLREVSIREMERRNQMER